MAVTAAVMEEVKGAAATAAEVMEVVMVEVEMEEAEMEGVGKAEVVTGVEAWAVVERAAEHLQYDRGEGGGGEGMGGEGGGGEGGGGDGGGDGGGGDGGGGDGENAGE